MPAAAWAARSGDSVLFTKRAQVPAATLSAVKAHDKPDIYILGPEAVIGAAVEKQLEKLGARPPHRGRHAGGQRDRAGALPQPRIRLGRDGAGLQLLARVHRAAVRPAAAATLATNGVYAPMLLTDSAGRLPTDLSSYLLDVQPGFEGDPSSGVYNRVWILGDEKVLTIPRAGPPGRDHASRGCAGAAAVVASARSERVRASAGSASPPWRTCVS